MARRRTARPARKPPVGLWIFKVPEMPYAPHQRPQDYEDDSDAGRIYFYNTPNVKRGDTPLHEACESFEKLARVKMKPGVMYKMNVTIEEIGA